MGGFVSINGLWNISSSLRLMLELKTAVCLFGKYPNICQIYMVLGQYAQGHYAQENYAQTEITPNEIKLFEANSSNFFQVII